MSYRKDTNFGWLHGSMNLLYICNQRAKFDLSIQHFWKILFTHTTLLFIVYPFGKRTSSGSLYSQSHLFSGKIYLRNQRPNSGTRDGPVYLALFLYWFPWGKIYTTFNEDLLSFNWMSYLSGYEGLGSYGKNKKRRKDSHALCSLVSRRVAQRLSMNRAGHRIDPKTSKPRCAYVHSGRGNMVSSATHRTITGGRRH